MKFSSKMNKKTWKMLRALSNETNRSISGLLTEAVEEYLKRKRIRPEVIRDLEKSMDENEELGSLLAK